MSLETGFWRIQGGIKPQRISPTAMDFEARLEAILESDIAVVSEPRKWMVIGRQIITDHGGRIDLLAIDEVGTVIVLELKRDKTDREVVSQVLDYASWVEDLDYAQIAALFTNYCQKNGSTIPLEAAFKSYFGVDIPEEINAEHEMVIVAAELHPESERVVRYLQKNYGVPVNAVFFSFFRDGASEYLSRSWLVEPLSAVDDAAKRRRGLSPRQVATNEFFTQCAELLNKQVPMDYAAPCGQGYYLMPTSVPDVHFEWGFHGRPRSGLRVQLHFEAGNIERNRALFAVFEPHLPALEAALREPVSVEDPWGSRLRFYIENPLTEMDDELATWAADKMAVLMRVMQPVLDDLARR